MSVIEQIEAAGWTVFESVTPEPKQWNVGYHDGPGEQNVPEDAPAVYRAEKTLPGGDLRHEAAHDLDTLARLCGV